MGRPGGKPAADPAGPSSHSRGTAAPASAAASRSKAAIVAAVASRIAVQEDGLVASPLWQLKAQELFTILTSRVGVVVLGAASVGKSSLLRSVGRAITRLNTAHHMHRVEQLRNSEARAKPTAGQVTPLPPPLP